MIALLAAAALSGAPNCQPKDLFRRSLGQTCANTETLTPAQLEAARRDLHSLVKKPPAPIPLKTGPMALRRYYGPPSDMKPVLRRFSAKFGPN